VWLAWLESGATSKKAVESWEAIKPGEWGNQAIKTVGES